MMVYKATSEVLYALLGLAAFYLLARRIAIWLGRRKMIRELGCQMPPSLPSMDPLLGLDSVLQTIRSVKENKGNMTLKQQLDTYGLTFRTNLYGRTKFFSADPQNLQAILSTDFESWGIQPMRLFEFEPLAGKGIMTTDGSLWANSRALIKNTFSRTQIADLSSFEGHVQRLIKLIPRDGSTINLQPLFSRLALDSSTEFLFGKSVESLSPSCSLDAQAFLAAYNYAQAGIGKRMKLPKWNILTYDPKFWESCKIARSFVEGYVDEAIRQCKSARGGEKLKLVLAYELARVTSDRDVIRNELLNVFLPGHDATAVALTNVFFMLARHPEVWTKLREEVVGLDISELTFENLKGLKYLRWVINETMRLHPVVGESRRIALRDTVLPTGGGPNGTSPILAKKGDIMGTSFYALHRLKDVYGEDADRFDPERWATLRPRHWAYLPFSGGPRVCIGQQLALTETAYATVRIVQTFGAIENRDPVNEFVELYKITTESKNGAKVALIPA